MEGNGVHEIPRTWMPPRSGAGTLMGHADGAGMERSTYFVTVAPDESRRGYARSIDVTKC
jgi:hypothetical protein